MMIDLTDWAAGHRGGIDGILAFSVLAIGSMCAVAVAVRLCSRLWRLVRHRSGEVLKPLFEDESFVFELWGAIVLGMVFMLKPDVLAPFTTPPTTFTEQVAEQAGLTALSCPTLALDDTIATMPRQDRYECEYVDDKGRAHDMSLLVASGDKVWLYDHQGKPLKVGE